ncbi:unnamed protein product [Clonostachys byssicola]|uniref:Uncharacterized protein n=1 Tax=Clonostachys byssicola TaxID=160290 RepID=A0A9N9XZZ9_9HYPO|nr:unnamed protein product [Clonostachys byssicola]
MAYSLYDGTIPVLKAALKDTAHLLEVAQKQPNASSLLGARLCEDMKPLTFQVYTVTKFTEIINSRLSGRETIVYEDNMTSYDEMHARINEVLARVENTDKDVVNKLGEEAAPTAMGPGVTMDLAGKVYAHGVTMPNILFHVSITYAILRKEGVPLGKADFMMPFVREYVPGM